MRQVLSRRRYERVEPLRAGKRFPDLILIDGGQRGR